MSKATRDFSKEVHFIPIDKLLDRVVDGTMSYGTISKKLEAGKTKANEDSLNSFLATLPAVEMDGHQEREALNLTLDLIKHTPDATRYVSPDQEYPLLSAVSNRYPNRSMLRGITKLLVEEGRAEVTEEAINHSKLNGDDKMTKYLKDHASTKIKRKLSQAAAPTAA